MHILKKSSKSLSQAKWPSELESMQLTSFGILLLVLQYRPGDVSTLLHRQEVYSSQYSVRSTYLCVSASVSPFTEPTSPNPTVSQYAQTTESLHTYGSYLTQCLPKFIQQFSVLKDELTVYVAPSGLIPVLAFLRDHSQCQFKAVMDISGVDFPEREKRFEVVYHLLSIRHQGRIRVKTYAGEADHVPSACELFRGADWLVNVARTLLNAHFRVTGMSEKLRIFTGFFSSTTLICMQILTYFPRAF